MKIKFGFKRRQTVYVTLMACAASLWMLVTRFGVSGEKLMTYLLICIGFVFVMIFIGAILALILRGGAALIRNKNND